MTSQIILITGASRGIGAQTAKLAAARGYRVVVNYLQNQAAANEVVSQIEAAGGQAMMVQADVGQSEEVDRLFETVDQKWGPTRRLVEQRGHC